MPIPDKESYWFMDCLDWREQQTVIFGQPYDYLTQNWGPDDHFEVLNKPELGYVQQFWHKTHENAKKADEDFYFFLQYHKKMKIEIFVVWVITFEPIII